MLICIMISFSLSGLIQMYGPFLLRLAADTEDLEKINIESRTN